MKKVYEKVINDNCHECPECLVESGVGKYRYCGRTMKSLKGDAYNIPIPKICPLKKLKKDMNIIVNSLEDGND